MSTRIKGDLGLAAAAGRIAERVCQINNPPAAHGDYDADAFGIPEFCRRHHISQSFYFKLQAFGLGPTTMRIGRRVLISAEEAARWRAERTAASKRSSAP